MKPTDELKQEHEDIKQMLKILNEVSARLDAGQTVDPAHLESMVEFIRVFADRCHHGKEEDYLFVAIEAAGIPRQGGPTGIMLEEHDEGRGYVGALAEGVERYKAGDTSAASVISQNARNYAELLDQHIDKENEILYEMADMHMTPEQQEEMSAIFARVETERIGPGGHEKYHQVLHDLKEVYLA